MQSVGEYLSKKYLCASVPSVGGYFSKRFLWVLRILWEDAVAALLVQWRPLHPLGGCVGMAGMPYPPIIAQTGGTKILRVLCNPWENISARNICAHLCHLWEDISARGFCGFCGFCGKIVWWLRGYGRMPYPPIVCTVCFVGALLALASGKAERRQLHPLELHPLKVCNKVAEYFSELCQRLFFSW